MRNSIYNGSIPLNDEDRIPWLQNIRRHVCRLFDSENRFVVVACSALKKYYRDILRGQDHPFRTFFVYLKVSPNVAKKRVAERKNHFFKVSLVDSQFEILEEPSYFELDVLTISNDTKTVNEVVDEILNYKLFNKKKKYV